MAIPPSGYPTTLDDTSAVPGVTIEFPQPGSGTDLDAANVEHDLLHSNSSLAIVALQQKVGIVDSDPTTVGDVLTVTVAGSTAWQTPPGDITGVTAGTAMSGGGTGPGAVTVNVDANAAGSVTAIATDYVLIEDVTDNSTKKALISDIVSLVPPSDPIPLILALS